MESVLLVSSTRGHTDPQETLRIQECADALLRLGWSVDVLVSRPSPLLAVVLDSAVRVFTVPKIPFSSAPCRRPSIRRFVIGLLMFLRGVALVSSRGYSVVHGINDGAIVARWIDRGTVRKFVYLADITNAYSFRGLFHGIKATIARWFERSALRHASAVILPDRDTYSLLDPRPSFARVSILPSPHVEFATDAFTSGEFTDAIDKIYYYVGNVPKTERK